mmetsp:Transcript_13761/g.28984  ORF Transcript_13761/g.28984 Transcript_13761/m.28984 type:complete len:336 (+) Transcript_13761:1093-2100(+)
MPPRPAATSTSVRASAPALRARPMLSEKLGKGTPLVHRLGPLLLPHALTNKRALLAPLPEIESPTPTLMTPKALSWWTLPMASTNLAGKPCSGPPGTDGPTAPGLLSTATVTPPSLSSEASLDPGAPSFSPARELPKATPCPWSSMASLSSLWLRHSVGPTQMSSNLGTQTMLPCMGPSARLPQRCANSWPLVRLVDTSLSQPRASSWAALRLQCAPERSWRNSTSNSWMDTATSAVSSAPTRPATPGLHPKSNSGLTASNCCPALPGATPKLPSLLSPSPSKPNGPTFNGWFLILLTPLHLWRRPSKNTSFRHSWMLPRNRSLPFGSLLPSPSD